MTEKKGGSSKGLGDKRKVGRSPGGDGVGIPATPSSVSPCHSAVAAARKTRLGHYPGD